MKVISVYNSKGGIGKTFISENLAYSLAKRGFNVLAIDADQKGYMTKHFGVNYEDRKLNGMHTLIGKSIANERISQQIIDDCIVRPTHMGKVLVKPTLPYADAELEYGLDLLPMTIIFEELEPSETNPADEKETCLLKIVSLIERFYNYDYIVVDCPPVSETIVMNGLYLNNSYVLIPVSNVDSARAVRELKNNFAKLKARSIRDNVNWGGPLGIILNQFNLRNPANAFIYENKEFFFSGHYLFNTIVPPFGNEVERANTDAILVATKNKKVRDAFELVVDEFLLRIETKESEK